MSEKLDLDSERRKMFSMIETFCTKKEYSLGGDTLFSSDDLKNAGLYIDATAYNSKHKSIGFEFKQRTDFSQSRLLKDLLAYTSLLDEFYLVLPARLKSTPETLDIIHVLEATGAGLIYLDTEKDVHEIFIPTSSEKNAQNNRFGFLVLRLNEENKKRLKDALLTDVLLGGFFAGGFLLAIQGYYTSCANCQFWAGIVCILIAILFWFVALLKK